MLAVMVILRYSLSTEYFPKFGCEVNNQKVFVCDADAKSVS